MASISGHDRHLSITLQAGGIQAGQMPSDTSSAVSFAMALAMNSILAAHLSLRNHATGAEDIFSQVLNGHD